jgi:hypothetical protein
VYGAAGHTYGVTTVNESTTSCCSQYATTPAAGIGGPSITVPVHVSDALSMRCTPIVRSSPA